MDLAWVLVRSLHGSLSWVGLGDCSTYGSTLPASPSCAGMLRMPIWLWCVRLETHFNEPNNPHLWWTVVASARMGSRLRYINNNSDLATEANSVCKRSRPHQVGSFMP